jgi:hypothetical protein
MFFCSSLHITWFCLRYGGEAMLGDDGKCQILHSLSIHHRNGRRWQRSLRRSITRNTSRTYVLDILSICICSNAISEERCRSAGPFYPQLHLKRSISSNDHCFSLIALGPHGPHPSHDNNNNDLSRQIQLGHDSP